MSDKALDSTTLELTQRIQLFFPRHMDPDALQPWNSCPRELITEKMREFFSKKPSFFRKTEEFTIEFPALKRPTLEQLQKEYREVVADMRGLTVKSIKRDISPEGMTGIALGTVLLPGGGSIDGDTYERRLEFLPSAPLGYQHYKWLMDNQDSPALHLFRMITKRSSVDTYIDFPGTIMLDQNDKPFIPSMRSRDDGRWHPSFTWLYRVEHMNVPSFWSFSLLAISNK